MRGLRCLLAGLLCLWPALALPQETAQERRDRGLLQGFLEDNLSGAGRVVRVEGFSGALSGRATIETLTIADDQGVWLTLSDAVLDWNRPALLRGRLEVAELSAARLEVSRAPVASGDALPAATASGRFALPELPVAVRIGTLALERISLGAPLLGEPVELSAEGTAELEGGAGAAELALRRLDGPQGAMTLQGSFDNASRQLALDFDLTEAADGIVARLMTLPGRPSIQLSVAGADPIDAFRADLRLATDGQERLTGSLRLETDAPDEETEPGRQQVRRVFADVSGDLAPVFAPEYRPFFGPAIGLSLSASLQPDGRQILDAFRIITRALDIEGSGTLQPEGFPARLNLTARMADPSGTPVLVPIGPDGTRVGVADLRLSFDKTRGDGWQLAGKLENLVQGGVALGSVDLAGTGRLVPPASGVAGQVNGAISLTASGVRLDDPALDRAVGPALRARLGFDWQSDAPLILKDLAVAGADYRLTGDVTLRRPEGALELLADIDTRLAADDLTRFAPLAGVPLSGAGNLAITGRLEPVAGVVDLRIEGRTQDLALGQPMVDPLLAGATTLDLRVVRDAAGTRIDPLSLQSAQARITGAAALQAQTGRATVTAEVDQLALILPGLTGPGTLRLRAEGDETGNQWQLEASARLPGDTRADWRGTLTDPQGMALLSGGLAASIGSLAPFSDLAGQRIGGAATLQADIRAAISDQSGSATLSATTRDITTGIPIVDSLLRGAGSVSAGLRRSADGRLILEDARVATPAFSIAADGAMTDSEQSVQFSARLADGRILTEDLPGPVSASGTARRGSGDWRLDLAAEGPAGTTLAANGTVAPGGRSAALGLTGRAPLSLVNARLRPRALGGLVVYDLRLDGPLALSALSGRLSTEGAQLSLPGERLSFDNIAAEAVLAGGRAQLSVTGALASGGRVAVSGPVSLSPPFVADLTVDLTGLVLRDPQLYRTTASGRVTLTGPLTNGARIGGVIDLGETEVRLTAANGPRFADLPGLVHLNEPAEVRRTRDWAGLLEREQRSGPASNFPIDLTVRAPARIFVRGRGLDAELGGELRLLGSTQALAPQGRFDLLRGRLDVLGRRLTLTEGYAQLQGSFEPYIYFAATTQAENVAVTLAIEGNAFAPELQITSSPDLPQDEILSLLLFGRDVTQISALQAVRLASALRTLSGRGGGLNSTLRRNLALDDFDVTTNESGQIEARAGKYLSDNLYTDITVNGAGETEINMNLKLSPSVTVRGRLGSDGDTGIGVYFEKDY